MAEKMVKCGACEAEIAISAKNCPKCGGRNKKYGQKTRLIVGGFFLVIGLLWAISDAQRGAERATGESAPTVESCK